MIGGRPRQALAVNGKFLAQPATGTQRYAAELTARLAGRFPLVLYLPRGAAAPAWLPPGVTLRSAPARGMAFEQLWLPWASRHDLLVSLAGSAPLLAVRQVAALHDAGVHRFPATYTRAFRAWHALLDRVLTRRAVALVTVSEFSAQELAEVLRVPRGRWEVVPDGSDHLEGLERRRPSLPGLDDPFLLCVGTPAAHKNLAAPLAALSDAGLRTFVVGARSARVFAASALPAEGVVRYAGRLADEELAWLYAHADALVFPSRYEGFGIPVVEAQRFGCPVVAADASCIPEIAGDGALLVDPDRPGDFVAAVRALRADPRRRAELVAAGRANAARLTWDASADTLAALLVRLLEEPSAPTVD